MGEVRIAAVVIAGGKRDRLLEEHVIPSVLKEPFDEVFVVGLFNTGEGYTYLHVPDLTKSTVDALVKRDVGTLASDCPAIFYLSDDHRVVTGVEAVKADSVTPWDVMVPRRYAEHPERGPIRIPNGESEGYCGGHGGIYRKRVIMDRPWSAMPHHRLWDVLASKAQQAAGFTYYYNSPIIIEDMETEGCPWQ